MKTDLQRIGNSRGVVIPKAILEKCGFNKSVNMRVEGSKVILSPAKPARDGWAEAFQAATVGVTEQPLLPDHMSEEWDEEEWTW